MTDSTYQGGKDMGTEAKSWQVDVEHPDTNATFVVVAGNKAEGSIR